MAKIKNDVLLGALMALNHIKGLDFGARTAMTIREMIQDVNGKWSIVEDVRKSFIDKFAERDEKGEQVAGDPINGQPTIKIAEDKRDAFNAAWKELLSEEVEIAKTLTIADFGDTKVSADTLLALGVLVAG